MLIFLSVEDQSLFVKLCIGELLWHESYISYMN